MRVGYYAHHVGHGHLHRAMVLAAAMPDDRLTLLSSRARPAAWRGEWVSLPRDDQGAAREVEAGGRLHWAPISDSGLRDRMATVSRWIAEERPDVVVVDVSVEVALLVRLHGIPVVGVVLPGQRTDAAHRLGFDVCSALVACWPRGHDPLPGLDPHVRARVLEVGAMSRFPVLAPARPSLERRVVVLSGSGGCGWGTDQIGAAAQETPQWSWSVIGGPGRWVRDPQPLLASADAVVTHAGESALAEVAACRRPAVVIPQQRPHDEQHATARALRSGDWPVAVLDAWPEAGWEPLLARTAALPGATWQEWCDGKAAARFADVLRGVVQ